MVLDNRSPALVTAQLHDDSRANHPNYYYKQPREGGFKDPGLERHLEACISQKQRLRHVQDPVEARKEKIAIIKNRNRKKVPTGFGQLSEDELQRRLRDLKPNGMNKREDPDKAGQICKSVAQGSCENELLARFRQIQQKRGRKESKELQPKKLEETKPKGDQPKQQRKKRQFELYFV